VSQSFAHETKAGEVACLTLEPLILLGAGGVVARDVEVAEGSTHSGHHLLKLFLLLLLVPEVVLLFALALVARVILVVVVLVGGVELLPLEAISDEVGGVTVLKVAPR
jgi:hypothetical protein